MKEHVVIIKLDVGLRRIIDGAAMAYLDIQETTYPGVNPAYVLWVVVFKCLLRALPEIITCDAVCRYDPFRGILAVRYGNPAGGHWIDGSNRLTKGRSLNGYLP